LDLFPKKRSFNRKGRKDPRVALRKSGGLTPLVEFEPTRIKPGAYAAPLLDDIPLIVLVDDSNEAASSLRNFLWTTFTKSDPASDVRGIGEFIENKLGVVPGRW